MRCVLFSLSLSFSLMLSSCDVTPFLGVGISIPRIRERESSLCIIGLALTRPRQGKVARAAAVALKNNVADESRQVRSVDLEEIDQAISIGSIRTTGLCRGDVGVNVTPR